MSNLLITFIFLVSFSSFAETKSSTNKCLNTALNASLSDSPEFNRYLDDLMEGKESNLARYDEFVDDTHFEALAINTNASVSDDLTKTLSSFDERNGTYFMKELSGKYSKESQAIFDKYLKDTKYLEYSPEQMQVQLKYELEMLRYKKVKEAYEILGQGNTFKQTNKPPTSPTTEGTRRGKNSNRVTTRTPQTKKAKVDEDLFTRPVMGSKVDEFGDITIGGKELYIEADELIWDIMNTNVKSQVKSADNIHPGLAKRVNDVLSINHEKLIKDYFNKTGEPIEMSEFLRLSYQAFQKKKEYIINNVVKDVTDPRVKIYLNEIANSITPQRAELNSIEESLQKLYITGDSKDYTLIPGQITLEQQTMINDMYKTIYGFKNEAVVNLRQNLEQVTDFSFKFNKHKKSHLLSQRQKDKEVDFVSRIPIRNSKNEIIQTVTTYSEVKGFNLKFNNKEKLDYVMVQAKKMVDIVRKLGEELSSELHYHFPFGIDKESAEAIAKIGKEEGKPDIKFVFQPKPID